MVEVPAHSCVSSDLTVHIHGHSVPVWLCFDPNCGLCADYDDTEHSTLLVPLSDVLPGVYDELSPESPLVFDLLFPSGSSGEVRASFDILLNFLPVSGLDGRL